MRLRVAVPLLVCLVLRASSAVAQEGIQLSWNDCGTSGNAVQTFACNSNSGSSFRMFGSARSAAPMSPVVTIISTLDISIDAALLPGWWQVHNAGTCRETAVSASVHAPGSMASCNAWENDQTQDAWFVQEGYGGVNHSRWDVYQFGNAQSPVSLPGGTENFLFTIAITRQKTVGAGSCIGCTAAACVTLRQVEFRYGDFSPGSETSRVMTTPLAAAGITWQSAAPSCLGAVPTPRSTWGTVKALYR